MTIIVFQLRFRYDNCKLMQTRCDRLTKHIAWYHLAWILVQVVSDWLQTNSPYCFPKCPNSWGSCRNSSQTAHVSWSGGSLQTWWLGPAAQQQQQQHCHLSNRHKEDQIKAPSSENCTRGDTVFCFNIVSLHFWVLQLWFLHFQHLHVLCLFLKTEVLLILLVWYQLWMHILVNTYMTNVYCIYMYIVHKEPERMFIEYTSWTSKSCSVNAENIAIIELEINVHLKDFYRSWLLHVPELKQPLIHVLTVFFLWSCRKSLGESTFLSQPGCPSWPLHLKFIESPVSSGLIPLKAQSMNTYLALITTELM